MADGHHCITCGKGVYEGASDIKRWYHAESGSRLCYPNMKAKPDHLFVEDIPGDRLLGYMRAASKYVQSDPAMAIFTRDMIDKVTTKAIEELEGKRSSEFQTLESRLQDAEDRIMELEGYPIRTTPALEILRMDERVKTLERIADDYNKVTGRLNQRVNNAWRSVNDLRKQVRAHRMEDNAHGE